MPQVEADNWYGLVTPIATPPIVASFTGRGDCIPEVKDKLASQGAIAVGNSSSEFAPMRSEIERWARSSLRRASDQVRPFQFTAHAPPPG
jgi:hypothetical protein